MAELVSIEQLSQESFAPFGDVLDTAAITPIMINRGMCSRYSDIARVDLDAEGRLGISIFEAKPYTLPLQLEMLERHPDGSQAFLPTNSEPFLVIVAEDQNGAPAMPRAFITSRGQGVNYKRGIWHGVLTPLVASRFFVVDRIGEGANLEEHWFETPFVICSPASQT